jgi:hypothetical protein
MNLELCYTLGAQNDVPVKINKCSRTYHSFKKIHFKMEINGIVKLRFGNLCSNFQRNVILRPSEGVLPDGLAKI